MELGINVSDLPYNRMTAYAKQADQLGLDSVWVGETWGWEAFTVLGDIARITDDIQLGTGIVPVYSRSPALLGQAAATVATASGNRFKLGLGTSGPEVVKNWHGFDFDRPVGRTAETIRIIRQVLSGDTVSHDGRSFDLDGFRFRMDVKDIEVPIWVGAIGETNVRMTGAVADGWMPIFVPRSRISDLQEELFESALERDRDPETLTVAPNTVVAVSTDGDDARDAVRNHVAFYVGAMGDFYYRMLVESGYEPAADQIRTAWKNEGPTVAAQAVPNTVVNDVAIVGTPEDANKQLDEFRELGADHFVGFFPRQASDDLCTETINHLAAMR